MAQLKGIERWTVDAVDSCSDHTAPLAMTEAVGRAARVAENSSYRNQELCR